MEYLTPANVQLGLCGIYLVAGAPKLIGAHGFRERCEALPRLSQPTHARCRVPIRSGEQAV
jgi:hypothetical protein